MFDLTSETALLAGSFHGINLEDFKYNTKKANPSDSPKHLNYKIIIKKKKNRTEKSTLRSDANFTLSCSSKNQMT